MELSDIKNIINENYEDLLKRNVEAEVKWQTKLADIQRLQGVIKNLNQELHEIKQKNQKEEERHLRALKSNHSNIIYYLDSIRRECIKFSESLTNTIKELKEEEEK